MTDADYADGLALLKNTPAKTESLLSSLEQASRAIKVNTTELMCFKQERSISTLSDRSV